MTYLLLAEAPTSVNIKDAALERSLDLAKLS